jgi:N utilization substance protein A
LEKLNTQLNTQGTAPMPNPELLRIVDGIARDKNIDREQVYTDVEQAIASALRKQFNTEDSSEFSVTLERGTGDINVSREGAVIPLSALGRIAAQTAKQVMIQLIRQDERGSIYEEFKDRVGTIVTGTIARFEGRGTSRSRARTTSPTSGSRP